jgi:broad specificity phosphatase PhoE
MVVDRARLGWARLQAESARHILICAHATINRGILAAILSLPSATARLFRMTNAAWARFTIEERGGQVRSMLDSWNNTDHLEGDRPC